MLAAGVVALPAKLLLELSVLAEAAVVAVVDVAAVAAPPDVAGVVGVAAFDDVEAVLDGIIPPLWIYYSSGYSHHFS